MAKMSQSLRTKLSVAAWCVIVIASPSWAFSPLSRLHMSSSSSRKTKTKTATTTKPFTDVSSPETSFRKTNKLNAKQSTFIKSDSSSRSSTTPSSSSSPSTWLVALATTTTTVMTATTPMVPSSSSALAASFSVGDLDPQNFQPVCPASDLFYRFLQGTTEAVVGEKSFLEYGPLIAGGLLRIRLELCVVESFFKEAVGPFIEQNGYSWILPVHETVETFLAGTIFALAATFILVGSTKILTVISTYTDFFVGLPFRVFGGFAFDRARGKPVTLDVGLGPFKTRVLGPPEKKKDDKGNVIVAEENLLAEVERWDNPLVLIVIAISGALKVLGQGLGIIREVMDGLDVFVGKYLVLVATAYIGIKFLHFKVFPDIIAF